ncbi:hypothetical protein [Muricoccus aerilatus]|uniref:hypothetical protein n=1 Tax=Muricoccus aerilatus TaxID=452982 RepID=UPI0006937D35|nr:hypothetical protein [Roseomonas aerilata]
MTRLSLIGGLGAAAFLLGLAAPAPQAAAQERRVFQVTPGPRIVTQEMPSLTDAAAIRRWLCPNGGTPMRGRPGRCDGRGVARVGGATGGGTDPDVAGWYADLPPPSRRQVACPAGTVAAEARLNPGTVRCVPG